MKNFFLYSLIILFIGCTCNEEEVGRDNINEQNKVYCYNIDKVNNYITNNNTVINSSFLGFKILESKTNEGPESCRYIVSQHAKQTFTVGSYNGNIRIDNSAFGITMENGQFSNELVLGINSQIIDDYLQNISINGFNFQDVLVIENNGRATPSNITKVIYSKTNGIEFILFEDGTWYKRVE